MERKALGLFVFTKGTRNGIINTKSKVTQNNGIAKRSGHDEKS
ncbi:hypothetical protein ACWGJQ_21570 [Peribacillus simplex]